MDSAQRIVDSVQGAAGDLGLNVPTAKEVKSIIGLSLQKAFETLFPKIETSQYQQLTESYRQYYVELCQTPSPLFEGVRECLHRLKDDNVLMAVATGKSRAGLNRVFDTTELSHLFVTSCCADEAESKPHPQMVNIILESLSIDSENALVVGDTSFDLDMAKSANVRSVGVSYGAHDVGVLELSNPIAIIDHIEQLHTFL